MWARSKNSEAKKPEKMERSGSQVIIRKDFLFVPETEEENAHWEYSECQKQNMRSTRISKIA